MPSPGMELRSPAPPASITLTPALPRFAQIEPIGRCNLACRMCTVNERGDEVAEMSLERFRSILDQLPDLEELHLQGLGEPMLHPAFFDMVEFAARRGIRVSANSNLTLLTRARARRCADSGLASLSVSLDGASAEVYEAIRRKASFEKVIRNLDRLVEARDTTGSSLAVRGVMVLMRSNLEELPALVRLLHSHRVDELLVQRLSSDLGHEDMPERYIPIRTYVENAELRPADITRAEAVFGTARELASATGFRLHLPRLREVRAQVDVAHGDGPRCRWPWDQLYVTAAGEMLPCCMVATADRATFGKVLPPSPAAGGLIERWHGRAAQAFRAALASDSPPEVCKSCALYHGTF
ncbi:MAG: radical SAM/SPASM domain-containing protein [Gammaproteobacteria bacterium]